MSRAKDTRGSGIPRPTPLPRRIFPAETPLGKIQPVFDGFELAETSVWDESHAPTPHQADKSVLQRFSTGDDIQMAHTPQSSTAKRPAPDSPELPSSPKRRFVDRHAEPRPLIITPSIKAPSTDQAMQADMTSDLSATSNRSVTLERLRRPGKRVTIALGSGGRLLTRAERAAGIDQTATITKKDVAVPSRRSLVDRRSYSRRPLPSLPVVEDAEESEDMTQFADLTQHHGPARLPADSSFAQLAVSPIPFSTPAAAQPISFSTPAGARPSVPFAAAEATIEYPDPDDVTRSWVAETPVRAPPVRWVSPQLSDTTAIAQTEHWDASVNTSATSGASATDSSLSRRSSATARILGFLTGLVASPAPEKPSPDIEMVTVSTSPVTIRHAIKEEIIEVEKIAQTVKSELPALVPPSMSPEAQTETEKVAKVAAVEKIETVAKVEKVEKVEMVEKATHTQKPYFRPSTQPRPEPAARRWPPLPTFPSAPTHAPYPRVPTHEPTHSEKAKPVTRNPVPRKPVVFPNRRAAPSVPRSRPKVDPAPAPKAAPHRPARVPLGNTRSVPTLTANYAKPTKSTFVSAALSNLPKPGEGSSSSAAPVRIRDMERARDLAVKRALFERLGEPEKKAASPRKPRATPTVGTTPGRATRARAAARAEFDAKVAMRTAEEEKKKAEIARITAELEAEMERESRKARIVRAQPLPAMYRR